MDLETRMAALEPVRESLVMEGWNEGLDIGRLS
jgi:hypothetical protein